MNIQYKIVNSLAIERVEREVNELLADGWELAGPLISSETTRPAPGTYSERVYTVFSQPMIKR